MAVFAANQARQSVEEVIHQSQGAPGGPAPARGLAGAQILGCQAFYCLLVSRTSIALTDHTQFKFN